MKFLQSSHRVLAGVRNQSLSRRGFSCRSHIAWPDVVSYAPALNRTCKDSRPTAEPGTDLLVMLTSASQRAPCHSSLSVPRPRLHLIRFHGVLAPNARALPELRRRRTQDPRGDCAAAGSRADPRAPDPAPESRLRLQAFRPSLVYRVPCAGSDRVNQRVRNQVVVEHAEPLDQPQAIGVAPNPVDIAADAEDLGHRVALRAHDQV